MSHVNIHIHTNKMYPSLLTRFIKWAGSEILQHQNSRVLPTEEVSSFPLLKVNFLWYHSKTNFNQEYWKVQRTTLREDHERVLEIARTRGKYWALIIIIGEVKTWCHARGNDNCQVLHKHWPLACPDIITLRLLQHSTVSDGHVTWVWECTNKTVSLLAITCVDRSPS